MSFVIGAKAIEVQIFETEDGKQFKTVEAAQKHQDRINAGEFAAVVVAADVEAFVNSEGLSGRARAIRINAISSYKAFMTAWDGEAVAFNQEAADKLAAAKAKPAVNGEQPAEEGVEQPAPVVEEGLL